VSQSVKALLPAAAATYSLYEGGYWNIGTAMPYSHAVPLDSRPTVRRSRAGVRYAGGGILQFYLN